MKRWIYTHQELRGDPERIDATLLARLGDLLRLAVAAPEGEPDGDGSFLVELESHVASVDLAKQIRVSIGVAHRNGGRVVLPLQWRAEPGGWMFPAFEGGIEWQPLSSDLGQLTLSGSYRIPLGIVGGMADATVFRGVAHRTAEHLLERLAHEIERVKGVVRSPSVGAASEEVPVVLHVRDVMTRDPIVLDESMPLRTAALLFVAAEIGGAPVVAADGGLAGVLTETDLLWKEAEQRYSRTRTDDRHAATTVGEACSRPAQVTAPDARLSAAAGVMLDADVSRLVVVGAGRVVGLLSRHDVLAALIRSDRELLSAVRRVLDTAGAADMDATVEWGEVTLHGSSRLRSSAVSLRRHIAKIDGVVGVTAEDVEWEVDDLIPPLSVVRM